MRKAGIFFVLTAAVVLLSAAPSAAQTASFVGNCPTSGGTANCQFDASASSCPASFVSKYSWNFGDGSGAFTGNPVVSHSYPYPGAGGYTVQLLVVCWDGATPTQSRFVCFSFGVPGCIKPNVGWN